ncbi:MAG: hypothetical protein WAN69_02410 [Candidatus Korobacteraceae bacterium]
MVLAVLAVAVSDISAQNNCKTVTGVSGVTPCLLSGTYVSAVTCPNGTTCGSAAKASALNLTPFNGTTGWHSYASGSAATYLNNLSTSIGAGVTFALSGTSSLRLGNGTTNNLPWLNPTNDNGYYLAASSNSPTITMTFDDSGCDNSNCIAQFSLYWGSVDSWNTITFTPTSGSPISLTGAQLATTFGWTLGQNDTASYVLNFEVPTGDALWYEVTLSSSYPAFEFDNLGWESVLGTTNGPVSIPSGTTPEPSGMLLLATASAAVAERLRRTLRSRS